jgi:hypothetical protein
LHCPVLIEPEAAAAVNRTEVAARTAAEDVRNNLCEFGFSLSPAACRIALNAASPVLAELAR